MAEQREQCPTCDRPIAWEREFEIEHDDCDGCAWCRGLCWGAEDCWRFHRVDWRARALKAEAALEQARAEERAEIIRDIHAYAAGKRGRTCASDIIDIIRERTTQGTDTEEPDLDACPQCGGPADNGIDRCVPPSPYLCSKCQPDTATPGEGE